MNARTEQQLDNRSPGEALGVSLAPAATVSPGLRLSPQKTTVGYLQRGVASAIATWDYLRGKGLSELDGVIVPAHANIQLRGAFPFSVGESTMSLAAILDSFDVPCSPTDKLVLILMANHADENGVCWPSIGLIQQKTGLGRRTVYNCMKRLREAGHIEVVKWARPSGRQTSATVRLRFGRFVSMHQPIERLGAGVQQMHPNDRGVQEMHRRGAGDAQMRGAADAPESSTLKNLSEETPPNPQGGDGLFPEDVIPLNEKPKPHKQKPTEEQTAAFEDAREAFKGRKRGHDTEFADFRRKHKDWPTAVHQLLSAVNRLDEYRERCIEAGEFCAGWPHFSTWLNQRRWEDEYPEVTRGPQSAPVYAMPEDCA